MGHACEILTFSVKQYTKDQIRAACDDWGNCNMDYHEGGYGTGLPCNISFTNKVFDSFEEAETYLDGTFGNYNEIAVQFKKPNKQAQPNKTLQDISRRLDEQNHKLAELRRTPHYANVKSKTIKCKNCGAVLPTEYCGKAFRDNCPICHFDLRPQTAIAKEQTYRKNIEELKQKYQIEQQKRAKQSVKSGYELYWAVACEVHN